MEEMMVTIPLSTYTELTVAASDGELLKRVLKEKATHYGKMEHGEIQDLCVMFGLLRDGGAG